MLNSIVHRFLLWLERSEVDYYRKKMQVGNNVSIERGLRVKKPMNVTIGDDVSIGSNVTLEAQDSINIGDLTLIANNVIIVTANHDMSKRSRITSPVKIGRNCWLGSGVIILPGVTIGNETIVGAGSVVTKDLPPQMVCAGIPAKPLKPRLDS